MDASLSWNCLVRHNPITFFRLLKTIVRAKYHRNPTDKGVLEWRHRHITI